MIQRDIQIKFLRNANRGQDIIRTMRMRLERNLLADDRKKGFQLHVKRTFLARVFLSFFDFLGITLCLKQLFTQKRCNRHARNRLLLAVLTIAALRIFTESNLHRDRILDNHVVHAIAVELHRDKAAAQHVRRTGARNRGRHAAAQRIAKRFIARVDAVNRTHLRRHRA